MSSTQKYARVPTTDEEEKRNKKRRSEAAEVVSTKIQALAWVLVGGFVMYHTDMAHVILQDPDVNRFWFNIAASTFAINCVLCFYLTVWIPYVLHIDIDWNVYCPRVRSIGPNLRETTLSSDLVCVGLVLDVVIILVSEPKNFYGFFYHFILFIF